MRSCLWLVVLVVFGFMLPPIVSAQPVAKARPVYYGVGVRFRGLFVPRSVFKRFVDVAPSGLSKPQLGFEVIRRRGRFDAALGIAWANLSPEDGIWVNDLQDLDDNPSLIEFDAFSWIALDVNVVWRRPVSPVIALRYGLGVGVGLLMGDILETDYQCPGSRYDLEACTQRPDARAVRKALKRPPVAPLINALLGIHYAPSEAVAITLDGGLQTTLFVGISVEFFFQTGR